MNLFSLSIRISNDFSSPLEQPNKSALQTNLFGSVLNVRGSGGGLHGRTDWAAKYLK